MKNKIIKLLYKIFSFLADKTNGWKIFVSPKLFLGALIVSGIAVSANSCRVSCYDPAIEEPMCYAIEVPDTTQNNDTIPDDVLCYYVGAPAEENQN